MKLTFTFTESSDLEILSRDDIYNTYFEFPDEASYLIGLRERVLGIAELVGQLTQVVLHITCKELDLLNNPVKLNPTRTTQIPLSFQPISLCYTFLDRAGEKISFAS